MIRIKNIMFNYSQKRVLNKISLDFPRGVFTFILGQNGAGKSTLLKCLNGILKVESGEVWIESSQYPVSSSQNYINTSGHWTLVTGYSIKSLAREIAFIPQEFHMQFDYTVREICLMGRYAWLDLWGNYTQNDYQIVDKYLQKLGLTEFSDRYFNSLSGGEKQRVLIARALVQDTGFILMDESLCNLDINHQIEILRLLRHINDHEGKTIIMVSHNLNLASEFADRIIVLKRGEVLASGSADEVFTSDILSKAFDMQMSMIENPFTGKKIIVYGGENASE